MHKILLIYSIALLFSQDIFAKDFGVVGHVIPVKENNLIEVIRERAETITDDQKDLLQQKVRAHYEKKLRNPTPVDIPETRIYSVHYFDPTVTVYQDIKDHQGKVIIEKGTKHNPLKVHSLNNDILLFDGDDKEQVEWAKNIPGIWVLVKGRPLDLEEAENRPVFFDQGGTLCKKFGIKSIPARVSQQDSVLKVESISKGERS